jgi:hypothetical protein
MFLVPFEQGLSMVICALENVKFRLIDLDLGIQGNIIHLVKVSNLQG